MQLLKDALDLVLSVVVECMTWLPVFLLRLRASFLLLLRHQLRRSSVLNIILVLRLRGLEHLLQCIFLVLRRLSAPCCIQLVFVMLFPLPLSISAKSFSLPYIQPF